MKVKCKECGKKIQTDSPIECSNESCQIKYPHRDEVFSFKNYEQCAGTIITDFNSPEPFYSDNSDLWEGWGCAINQHIAPINVDKDGDEIPY